MANPTGAFGLLPIRHDDGSSWNGVTIPCFVSSSYATALFIGDPVLISPTTAERQNSLVVQGHPAGIMQTINKSAGTDGTIIRGVITSFEPLYSDLTKKHNPASTERIANVCVDPSVVYKIRGSGVALTKNAIGANAVCIAGAGNATTGLSGTVLDEGTTTAPAADQSFPLLIVGIHSDPSEEPFAAYAAWEVKLNTYNNAVGEVLGVLGA